MHPKIGFYVDPVITLDFESLYPSTMRTGNFCITTWVWPEDVDALCTKEAGFVTRDEVEARSAKEPCLAAQHDDDSVTKAHWARALDKIAAKKVKSKADLAFLDVHKSYVEMLDYIRPNTARLEQGSPQGSKENNDYFVQTSVRAAQADRRSKAGEEADGHRDRPDQEDCAQRASDIHQGDRQLSVRLLRSLAVFRVRAAAVSAGVEIGHQHGPHLDWGHHLPRAGLL